MFVLLVICLLTVEAFLADGLTFHCQFAVDPWAILGDIYECNAIVQSTGNEMILNDVTGDHLRGKSNLDVVGLVVHDQNVTKIPGNITRTDLLPNIIAIIWRTSNLQTISAEDLEQFPNLKVLSIYQNQVTTLDGNLFTFTRSLKSIGFYKNNIRNVGEGLLNDLSNLEIVNFGANPCVNTQAATKQEISTLNLDLPRLCPMPLNPTEPPVTTTTTELTSTTVTTESTSTPVTTESTSTQATDECIGECLDLIKSMNETIYELREKLEFCMVTQ